MRSFFAFALLFASSVGFASEGLVINTAEIGVGKFHRYDNQVHAYDHASAWAPYVLPNGASSDQPLIRKNPDGSFTVFFSTLDDLISSVIQVSDSQKQKVSVLNIHGHGLPGAMWFPKDAATMSDFECSDWKDAADGSDQNNYSQYYSAVSVDEINQIRQMGDNPNIQMGCTTGLKEWQAGVAKNPHFKDIFADDAQIHFLSCVVGLGKLGEQFTQGIAELLLPKADGRVETSMDFGLGDFSMPEGMGFWDYQTDAQVDHDNSIYVVDHKDREIAQKGTIRMATFANGHWDTSLLSNRDFMVLSFESGITGTPVLEKESIESFSTPLPNRVRVPGTTAYVSVRH